MGEDEPTQQGALGLALAYKLLGLHIPLPKRYTTVMNVKGADVAVSIKPLHALAFSIGRRMVFCSYGIVFNEGGQLRIGHYPVEYPIDILGDLAVHLQMRDVTLKATWFHESRELGAVREVSFETRHHEIRADEVLVLCEDLSNETSAVYRVHQPWKPEVPPGNGRICCPLLPDNSPV
jgi:hypothetical protein